SALGPQRTGAQLLPVVPAPGAAVGNRSAVRPDASAEALRELRRRHLHSGSGAAEAARGGPLRPGPRRRTGLRPGRLRRPLGTGRPPDAREITWGSGLRTRRVHSARVRLPPARKRIGSQNWNSPWRHIRLINLT